MVGRRLVEAWAFPHPKFTPALDATGRTITGLVRRGKFLLFGLDNQAELIVHLGMTGSLQVHPVDGSAVDDPYVRAYWVLSSPDETTSGDEVLVYRDVRRFGRLAYVEGGDYQGTLATQGPDALDPALTVEQFWRSLRGSRRAIKTQLLSQRPLAGVGNIYADEALWLAGINPKARRIGRGRATDLLEALRHVLVESMGNGGTTLRDYRNADGGTGDNQRSLSCYGRAGEPCLRCGTILRRVMLDGRSTTYCPSCQAR